VKRLRSLVTAERIKAGFLFAATEGGAQVLALVVGLIVVRNMRTIDYGYYTICIATIGICNALANSGLSAGFRKIGGEVHQDRSAFSALYSSAVRERRLQTLFVLPVCIGIAFWFLYRLEADLSKAVTLALLVGVNALPELWRAISVEVLLLKSSWRTVQLQNLLNVVLRIGLILALLGIGLNAENMLVVNAIALWVVGYLTFRVAKTKVCAEPPSLEVRRQLRKIMNRVLPNAVFSVAHAQLGTFVLASRGTVEVVADYGALRRLTALFGVGVSAVSQIVAPKFAKTHSCLEMRRIYKRTMALVFLVAIVVIAVTFLFPTQLLWLLGPKYEHLQSALLLAALLAMLQVAKTVVVRLNQAKAWIFITTAWNIPSTLVAIGLGFWIFNTSTLNGVLGVMLLSLVPILVLYGVDAHRGFAIRSVKDAPSKL
jgi:O-antigen/teichoic acid export membrane protein